MLTPMNNLRTIHFPVDMVDINVRREKILRIDYFPVEELLGENV